MHTSIANANCSTVLCIAMPIPAMRISGSNGRGKGSLTK